MHKVDSGIGLSYRPVRLHRLADLYNHPLCSSQLYAPVRDYEFGYLSLALTVLSHTKNTLFAQRLRVVFDESI